MADRIRTIGTGGDYADPILWAAGEGNINDGDRAVGVIINDIAINALFRPNQSFPNGGLLKGNVTVTGEPNVGITFSNAASSRFCLSPSPNLDFEDLLLGRGGASRSIGFQNSSGSAFTRIIFNPADFSNSIYPIKDTTTIVRNCVLSGLFLNSSNNNGELDLENCITTDRILCRSNNLLKFKNSISLASDWYLGRPTDSGAESLVNYSRIKQNANANEFGPGSSDNVVNYDSTNDLVNFATNDFRTRSDSSLATAGEGGTFIGAFLQSGGGGVISIPLSSSLCSYISNGVNLDLTGEIQVSLSVTSQTYTPIDLILTQTPEIKVNLDNSSYSYSPVGASFELSGLVDLPLEVAGLTYISSPAEIALQGTVSVEFESSNYTYTALGGTISLRGPILLNLKNKVLVKRKANSIRVKRKNNNIRVK